MFTTQLLFARQLTDYVFLLQKHQIVMLESEMKSTVSQTAAGTAHTV